jgi:hypothetical protein
VAARDAPTADHIFAREFFLIPDRGSSKAPCCGECGSEKSKDENYLIAVLPLEGLHSGARENLTTMLPKRLARDRKLHEELAVGMRTSELGKPRVVPLDTSRLVRLFAHPRGIGLASLGSLSASDASCGGCAVEPPMGKHFLMASLHRKRVLAMRARARVFNCAVAGKLVPVFLMSSGPDHDVDSRTTAKPLAHIKRKVPTIQAGGRLSDKAPVPAGSEIQRPLRRFDTVSD